MARLLHWNNTNAYLQEMTDTQMENIAHYLQLAYRDQVNVNGNNGSFFIGGNGSAGVATNTRRIQQSGSGNNNSSDQGGDGTHSGSGAVGEFPGTAIISNNQNYQNFVGNPSPTSEANAPLVWSSNQIRRANEGLLTELFTIVRDEIRTGNEVGSYRVAVSNPGGWTSKGTMLQDTRYNTSAVTYTLWFNNQTPSAPTENARCLFWNTSSTPNRIQEQNGNTSALINTYLLPVFTSWANDNGLNYRVQTSNGTYNRGTFTDTRRQQTSNVFSAPDTYTSTPVGNPVTITTYYLNMT